MFQQQSIIQMNTQSLLDTYLDADDGELVIIKLYVESLGRFENFIVNSDPIRNRTDIALRKYQSGDKPILLNSETNFCLLLPTPNVIKFVPIEFLPIEDEFRIRPKRNDILSFINGGLIMLHDHGDVILVSDFSVWIYSGIYAPYNQYEIRDFLNSPI